MHCQQAGHSDTFGEQLAHAVSGGFGGHHHHVDGVRYYDFLVMDAETVGDHEGASRPQIGLDLLPVDPALKVIGNDHH